MLEPAVSAWLTEPNGLYIDGTFGRGGHSRALLARLGAAGRLVGIDKDPQAVSEGRSLQAADPRFTMLQGSFAAMASLLGAQGIAEPVAGVLLDLGVSSPQDRKSTRLNSSHVAISYAVFCLKKKRIILKYSSKQEYTYA